MTPSRHEATRNLAASRDKYMILSFRQDSESDGSGANIACFYDTLQAAEAAAEEFSPAVSGDTATNVPEDLFSHPDPRGPLLFAGHICAKVLHHQGNRFAVIVRSPVNPTFHSLPVIAIADHQCAIAGHPTESEIWQSLQNYVHDLWNEIIWRPCASAEGLPMIAPAEPPTDMREAIRTYFDARNASTPGASRLMNFPCPAPRPRPLAELNLVPTDKTANWYLYWENTPIAVIQLCG